MWAEGFRTLVSRTADTTIAVCKCLATIAIAFLLAIVVYSIAARVLFDLSAARIALMIPGAIELAAYALLVAVFAAIPASLAKGLVSVDILSQRLPAAARRALDRLWFCFLLVVAIALVWLFSTESLTMYRRGDLTQDLGIPLFFFYAVIAAECAALCLVCVNEIVSGEASEGEIT